MKQDNEQRHISISLYLAALLITAAIFLVGIYVGKMLEQQNLNSISSEVSDIYSRMNALQLLYLMGDSPAFCEFYQGELSIIDANTAELGYKLAYFEDVNGMTDIELKKNYFMLEAESYFLSQKVMETCNSNHSIVLYFYSNANCTECKAQSEHLLALKNERGDSIRIYSFDGDLGSPVADALKQNHNVMVYPSLVINNNTYSGIRDIDWLLNNTG